jgi:hypothetical protein
MRRSWCVLYDALGISDSCEVHFEALPNLWGNVSAQQVCRQWVDGWQITRELGP